MTYFSSGGDVSDAPGTYDRLYSVEPIEAAPGVSLQAITGERLMVSRVTIQPHSEASVHTHDEEQLGIILEGTCEFELAGDVRQLHPGDVYHAPPGVPHGARTAGEQCIILDVFAPPRQALLDLMNQRPSE